jgi:hypothetical protein
VHSRLLALLFAFLLLGMQQEAQLHAISHIGGELQRPHDQGLQLPVDAPCAECALLAGGSTAAPADSASFHAFAAGFAAPRGTAPSPAFPAPTYYHSRAPPSLL